jgi:hypothetical protein
MVSGVWGNTNAQAGKQPDPSGLPLAAGNSISGNTTSENDIPIKLIPESSVSSDITLEEADVSVTQNSVDCFPVDTEAGEIDICPVHINLPTELPLCIKNETLQDYYCYIIAKGGYTPHLIRIEVQQWDKYGSGHWDTAGYIYGKWTPVPKDDHMGLECCWDVWEVTFYVEENFCIKSNKAPDNIGGDFELVLPECFDLNKPVRVWITSQWSGCPDPNQHFDVNSIGPFEIDTEAGKIEICHMDLPTELPLCINTQALSGYEIIVAASGGYRPHCGKINVYQWDKNIDDWVWKGKIKIRFTEVAIPHPTDCCWKAYRGIFIVDDEFCIDSNKAPVVGNDFDVITGEGFDLDKPVCVDVTTKWSGCPDPCQRFEVMLAHKRYDSRVPNSRRNDISPVLK